MAAVKVATCCYCGTRAALVLKGQDRHELACRACGAPLRKLKMLPIAAAGVTAPKATPTHPRPHVPVKSNAEKPRKNKRKKSKFNKLKKKAWSEIWDVVEDIFD